MNENRQNDEMALIDFLLGRCDADAARQLQERIARDESFRQLHDDLSNAFCALKTAPDAEPSEDLVVKTLMHIHSARRTEALIAKEELTRPAVAATFSIRELSVAAAAVLILAVVFVPSIRQARNLARINECAAQVGQIGTALLTYANANDGYLPAVNGGAGRWLPSAGQPAVSNSAALFKLVNNRYVRSPVVFQCPGIGGSSFEVKSSMTDFPAGKYIGYSYQHTVGKYHLRRTDHVLVAVAGTMAILADSSPIFDDGKFQPDRLRAQASINHGRTGQNVLYLDMHVEWAKAPTVGVDGDNIYLARGIVEYRGDEAPAEPTDSFLLPSYSAADVPNR